MPRASFVRAGLALTFGGVVGCGSSAPPPPKLAALPVREGDQVARYRGAPIVKAVVGGVALDAIVDTSVGRSRIDERFMKRIGWPTRCEGSACAADLPKLSLGRHDVLGVRADVVPVTGHPDARASLVLGTDALAKLAVTFDAEAGEVRWAFGGATAGTPLAVRDGAVWLEVRVDGAPRWIPLRSAADVLQGHAREVEVGGGRLIAVEGSEGLVLGASALRAGVVTLDLVAGRARIGR